MADIDRLGLIAELAARLMDQIEEDMGSEDCDIGIEAVALVVELRRDEGEHGQTRVMYRCSDTRPIVQAGLLMAAADSARDWGESASSEDGDEGGG